MLNERHFWPLFWTQFLGALNDNFLKNAMVLLIEYKGLAVLGLDPPSIVALSGGIFIMPFFLFSMLAGQIADKRERSSLVRWVKVWELCITLVSTGGFYFHSVGLLLGALFMMGMHSTFFGPIKYSAIPELVKEKNLMAANAYVEIGTFLAILLGTLGGGLMIQLPHGELVISVALNFCALLGLFSASRLVKLPASAPHLKIRLNPISPVIETFHLLREKPDVYQSIMGISWFWFFGAAALSILPPYCKEYLHADGHVMTTFLAMWTIGIGFGSWLSEKLSFHRVELALVPLGSLGITLFLADLSRVAPGPWAGGALQPLLEFINTSYGPRLLVDFFFMSVAGGLFILPLYTVMQARSERAYRSRVIAGNNVFNAIFMVISALTVMTMHLKGVSLPRTLFLLALANLVFAAYIYWMVPEFLQRSRAWVRERLTPRR